jgi:hypothetical protein
VTQLRELFEKRKLSPSSVAVRLAALRFNLQLLAPRFLLRSSSS